MSVRLVVFALLGLVMLQVSAGLASFFANEQPLPFDIHRYGAAAVLIILVFKGGVIYRSLKAQFKYHRVRPGTYLSLFLLFELVSLLLLALLWFFRVLPTFFTGSTTPLDLHIWIALALVPLMFVHAALNLYRPRMRAPTGRRDALKLLAVGAGAIVLWQLTVLGGALTNPPQTKRFTGSRDAKTCPTCYPPTVWLFDSSPVINAEQWVLRVRGRVERELTLRYADVAGGTTAITAPVDCTGGWFATLTWQGTPVREVLEMAGVATSASLVTFYSVTGHSTVLPLEEAKGALLATHSEGQVLPPEHGFPMRLVAPARRGFQWIKWLDSIEVS